MAKAKDPLRCKWKSRVAAISYYKKTVYKVLKPIAGTIWNFRSTVSVSKTMFMIKVLLALSDGNDLSENSRWKYWYVAPVSD